MVLVIDIAQSKLRGLEHSVFFVFVFLKYEFKTKSMTLLETIVLKIDVVTHLLLSNIDMVAFIFLLKQPFGFSHYIILVTTKHYPLLKHVGFHVTFSSLF